jgi:hypothetical protein
MSHHFSNETDPPELQMVDRFLLDYLPAGTPGEEHWLLMVQLEAVRKDLVRRLAGGGGQRDLRLVC